MTLPLGLEQGHNIVDDYWRFDVDQRMEDDPRLVLIIFGFLELVTEVDIMEIGRMESDSADDLVDQPETATLWC